MFKAPDADREDEGSSTSQGLKLRIPRKQTWNLKTDSPLTAALNFNIVGKHLCAIDPRKIILLLVVFVVGRGLNGGVKLLENYFVISRLRTPA